MGRLLAAVVFGGAAVALAGAAFAQSQAADVHPVVKPDSLSGGLGDLPPAPSGVSTILGGQIRSVDPVRDELTLQMFGERPMKIFFDERTQVFLDGKRIPLLQLGHEEHASIQTTLDGSNVFALSIHILSQSPEGDYQGRVIRYDRRKGELEITEGLSPLSSTPFTVVVSPQTALVRTGETRFTSSGSGASDLVAGSLVSVQFASNSAGQGVAQRITILAVPGSSFVFSGSIASLNTASGSLVVLDPRDQRSYQIYFDAPLFPETRNLHPGDHVRVVATYNGNRYLASEISGR
jgi:hypothetical protein